MQMNPAQIFGYGSLINEKSLRATVPDAFDLRLTFIKGFVRDFSLWDSEGFTETNLDVAGIPYCALDVKSVVDQNSRVNGVVFSVNSNYFDNLLKREQGYELVKTIGYGFHTNEKIGECYVFSANKNNGEFDTNSKAQKRYLEVCLSGAKGHGQKFYKEFMATTYIGKVSLDKMPDLYL